MMLLLSSLSVAAGLHTPLPSRRAVLLGASAASSLGLPQSGRAADSRGFVLAAPERGGLQARWLEQLRVTLQDEADATMYGGELAPGGPPASSALLLLVPIVHIESTLASIKPLLADASRWPSIVALLSSGPFDPSSNYKELKRIFNAYSDNIYYSADSAEANLYLLGGATPSSRQTSQYLLRNEIIKQAGEIVDELKYQQGLPTAERESDVAEECVGMALKAFAEYFALAPQEEVANARAALQGAAINKKS
jgi:hypothetical protein